MPRYLNLALLLALAACGDRDPLLDRVASDTVVAGKLRIHTILALPPFTDAPMPVYLTVVNGGPAEWLLEASSPVSTGVALHGQAMHAATAMAVPAGGELALRPGGVHVMLDPPLPALVRGDSVQLRLRFARAGTVVLWAPVIDYAEVDAVLAPR